MKEVINMSNNDQEFLVQKIRTQYTEKQHTELDALKELDAKVKRPANVFAYVYGSVSAIIMGTGMSLVMTEIGEIIGLVNTMVPGILVGILGKINDLGAGINAFRTGKQKRQHPVFASGEAEGFAVESN